MLYFAVGKRALLTVYSVNGHFNALLRKICFSSHVAFEALIHNLLSFPAMPTREIQLFFCAGAGRRNGD